MRSLTYALTLDPRAENFSSTITRAAYSPLWATRSAAESKSRDHINCRPILAPFFSSYVNFITTTSEW